MDANDAENTRGALTKNQSLLLSSLSEKNRTIFSLRDVMDELGSSYNYAKVLASNLARKNWIVVLKRGTYLIVPLSAGVRPRYTEHEFLIASHLVSPYYIAYWSALNFHGFTEQNPFTVFVATTKRIRSREVLNVKYRFVTLGKTKFFGFTATAMGANKVNISDREKTIADALDHPEYCGGIAETAKSLSNASDKISLEKLVEYGQRMGNSAILKRLGYLAETLLIPAQDETITRMKDSISSGITVLDPSMPKTGRYATRWNLLLNVPAAALMEWRRGL